jgi:hypothetical protein
MNFLKRAVFVTLLSSTSIAVHAELELLDGEKMSEVKDQAGITIYIKAALSIGGFAYKGGRSFLVQGLQIGGNSNLSGRTYANNSKDLTK